MNQGKMGNKYLVIILVIQILGESRSHQNLYLISFMSRPCSTRHDIVRFGPHTSARPSQAVTHPDTAPAQAHLTPEFFWDPQQHGFKTHHVDLRRGLTYKRRVSTRIFPMWDLDKASQCYPKQTIHTPRQYPSSPTFGSLGRWS